MLVFNKFIVIIIVNKLISRNIVFDVQLDAQL